ncbi:hypothetical protein [Arthrobacter sp. FW306-06-A]|uniref:hypothetical protein n=1 Tax=Arthrobacter sp. FW306-06-A TaxID=2879621 RepID=UPI001F178654|nr:hypothetical protein [Arthrobacter sp. FW306-06-A]UKA70892.1 hypothetical protein LFT49_19585 [Arthrobacter sp. FW306-06-A]
MTAIPWSSKRRCLASIPARLDITLSGDDLRINVRHEEKTEHKDKRGYRSEVPSG